MTKIKVYLTILFLSVALFSQEIFSLKTRPLVNQSSSDTLIIGGKTFITSISAKGNYSIKRVSKKTGNKYRQYLGYLTKHKFDNKLVFTNHNLSKYWILALGRTGYPKKIILNKNN